MEKFKATYKKENGTEGCFIFDSKTYNKEKAEKFLNDNGIKNFFFFFEPNEPVQFGENGLKFSGEVGFDITVSNLIPAINEGKDIIIDSFGGDLWEGWKIYDSIKALNINPSIGVIGTCASAAMQILLATENRWISENSRGLVHNPWVSVIGDDYELRSKADELEKEKLRLANLYASISGKLLPEILDLMKKEILLSSDEMISYNFAKSKVKDLIIDNNSKQDEKMNEDVKKEMNLIQATLAKVLNFLKPPKNIILQDVNGVEIDFGSEVETENQISTGLSATVAGSPAEGKYVMPDGRTFVFEGGILTEIMPAGSEDVEALKAENEDLKKQLAELQNQLQNSIENEKAIKAKAESEVKTVAKMFEDFKNKFSDDKPVDNLIPEPEPKQLKMTYKFK